MGQKHQRREIIISPFGFENFTFSNSRNINLLVLTDATKLMIQILLSFDVLHEWGLKKLSNGGDMRWISEPGLK